MDIKTKLKKQVWRSDIYYQMAKKGSLDMSHPGMIALKQVASKSDKILDLGCGEGTRLKLVSENAKEAIGIDISQEAINLARKTYKNLKFINADLEKLPLEDESFDLVYSAYVLEHLSEPEMVLHEALRVLSKNGNLVLVAPNYGAPNRCSPVFKGSRLEKLIRGVFNDSLNLLNFHRGLNWDKVNPIANKENYDIDWDTTIEPYLGSLIVYLRNMKLNIKTYSSCWSEELIGASFGQKFLRFLGEKGVYPFNFWGPHLVIVAQK